MDYKNCKECKYYKVWYHGETNFSRECLLALKDPETIKEYECINFDGKKIDNNEELKR